MNYQTSKKKNMDWKKNFKLEKKNFKRDFCKAYKLCKDARIGLESIFLGTIVMPNCRKKRKSKKKEILSVMINFLTELYKIKRRKKMNKLIIKKTLKLNKQLFKICGCLKTVL